MDKFNEKQFKELIVKFKNNGFETSFEELYEKYNTLIFKIAYSITKSTEDSEDVVQSVFSKIYTMPKESLPSNHCLSWLYSVSKNEAISLIRKKKNTLDLDSVYEIQDNNNELNDIIDTLEFNRIIDGLNNKDKEIISLKLLTNLSFSEASGSLRIFATISLCSLRSINEQSWLATFAIIVKASGSTTSISWPFQSSVFT